MSTFNFLSRVIRLEDFFVNCSAILFAVNVIRIKKKIFPVVFCERIRKSAIDTSRGL